MSDNALQTQIRNSYPGGLRPNTLPLGHGSSPQYWVLRVGGEETFLLLSNRYRTQGHRPSLVYYTLTTDVSESIYNTPDSCGDYLTRLTQEDLFDPIMSILGKLNCDII